MSVGKGFSMATASRRLADPWSAGAPPGAVVHPAERALLEAVRAGARAAQLGARLDLDHGCALIDPPADRAAACWGAALMRALDVAALRPLSFHPAGAATAAFGEAWAMRLVAVLRQGDAASAQVLLCGMVRRERRRLVLWLATRFAAALDQAEAAAAEGARGTGQSAVGGLAPLRASQRAASQPHRIATGELT